MAIMRVKRKGWMIAAVVLSVTVLGEGSANAQDRGQTRSMVVSKNGIVAAESPLAAQVGGGGLRRGRGEGGEAGSAPARHWAVEQRARSGRGRRGVTL